MARRCIFLLADGAREDLFRELLSSGRLPRIAEELVAVGSYVSAVTVFPSTTGPAYAPFLMGKFPGRCNLPGIRWLDRYRYASTIFSLDRMRSYVGIESLLFNRDISTRFKTMFEIVRRPSASILNEFTRGVSRGGNKTGLRGSILKAKANYDRSWDAVDRFGAERLLGVVENGGVEFVYCVFTAIDHYSHLYHPFHRKVLESYAFLDETVGRLVEVLRRRGELDDTLIVISSDHGLTATHTHFDSVGYLRERGYKTLYYPLVFRHWRDAEAATMISGNSMTHIYLKSPEGWGRTTTYEEAADLVSDLVEREGIDIVAGVDGECNVRIRSRRGEAAVRMDGEGFIRYTPLDGGDPFGYGPLPERMSLDEALRLTSETPYPDAPLQLLQIFESPRSGDLVVSASVGYDLRSRFENPEHCSSHGSLARDHMMVPLVVNRPLRRGLARTADLFPTMLEHLGYPVPEGIDGESLF